MNDQPSPSHADKIKFERNLMQATGMSRTQLRKELKEFNAQQTAVRQTQEALLTAFGAANKAVQVRETKLAPVTTKLETGTQPPQAVPIATFQDATVPTNSGAGNAILKTGTNVVAKTLVDYSLTIILVSFGVVQFVMVKMLVDH